MKKLIPLTIYSVAMGFLEAAVVVYLRELYYPAGFAFPLNPEMPQKIFMVELSREMVTIIMLLSVGFLAGTDPLSKVLYFLFAFGLWDIFYYVGLKIYLNWPNNLLTWDLLFLIPVPWVGPVLAPVLCSITMMVISLLLLYLREKYQMPFRLNYIDILTISAGAFIIFLTFIEDFAYLMWKNGLLQKYPNLIKETTFQSLVRSYVPKRFNWALFLFGEAIIIQIFALVGIKWKRIKQSGE